MTANPIQHARTKHIEIDIHFVREQVKEGKLQVNYIPSYHQKADILTKALSAKNFTRLRDALNIGPIDPKSTSSVANQQPELQIDSLKPNIKATARMTREEDSIEAHSSDPAHLNQVPSEWRKDQKQTMVRHGQP